METKYHVLNGKITEKSLLRRDIAESLGISCRAFRNKMTGETAFTWDEVKLIRNKYFPEYSNETVLSETLLLA